MKSSIRYCSEKIIHRKILCTIPCSAYLHFTHFKSCKCSPPQYFRKKPLIGWHGCGSSNQKPHSEQPSANQQPLLHPITKRASTSLQAVALLSHVAWSSCADADGLSSSRGFQGRAIMYKTLKLATVLVLTYMVCWTPYNIVSMLPHALQHYPSLFYLHHLIALNSVINPLVYRTVGRFIS